MQPMALVENFRKNLRLALDRERMTQGELAAKSGVHQVTISRILTGALEPSLSTVEKLALHAKLPLEMVFLKAS